MTYLKQMKWIWFIALLFSFVHAQDITYTNENVQVVNNISPDEGIVEDQSLFSVHGNWTSQFRYNNVLGAGECGEMKCLIELILDKNIKNLRNLRRVVKDGVFVSLLNSKKRIIPPCEFCNTVLDDLNIKYIGTD